MEESKVLDRLHQYLRDDDKATKNQKEEIQTSGAIASHVGGSPKSIDLHNYLLTVPEEKNDPLTQSHQLGAQKNDESLTRRFEPLFDGGDAESWVLRVEQYFERGKVTEEKLFGSLNTEKKGENQSAEMDRNACQEFDKMTQGGKSVTNKRKKKRWKEIAKKNITTGVKRKMHNRQMFNRWLLWSLTEKKKRANWEHERKVSSITNTLINWFMQSCLWYIRQL